MNAPVVKKQSQRSQSMNTPEVRVAYPSLHEKRTKNAAGLPLKTPRFEATLLFPKLSSDAASCPNYKFISDLCMEAAGKMWPGVGWPAGGLWPIKDGDVPYISKPKPGVVPKTAEQIAAANAWRVGHWVVEVTNFLDTGPKVVVMKNGRADEIPAKVINGVVQYKSGDFGIAHMSAYAYENDQWGTNLSFEGILFTRAGELIGSSGPRTASQMFGSVAGTVAPPAAALAPAPGGSGGALPLPVAHTAPSAIAGQVPIAMASVAPSSIPSAMPPSQVPTLAPRFPGDLNPPVAPMPPMPPAAALPPLPIPR